MLDFKIRSTLGVKALVALSSVVFSSASRVAFAAETPENRVANESLSPAVGQAPQLDALRAHYVGLVAVNSPNGNERIASGVSSDQVIELQSISKMFTALAVLRLCDAGKLTLDTPLSEIWDNVPGDKAKITVRQLLYHTSGITSEQILRINPTDKDAIRSAILEKPLRYSPGTRFVYSNTGYSLLAIAVEERAQQPFELAVSELLFKPAKLTTAAIKHSRTDPTKISWTSSGASNVMMSTDDFAAFMQVLCSPDFLSENSKQELTRASFWTYGCGVIPATLPNGHKIISHGGNGDNETIFWTDLTRGTTVTAFTSEGELPISIQYDAAVRLLDKTTLPGNEAKAALQVLQQRTFISNKGDEQTRFHIKLSDSDATADLIVEQDSKLFFAAPFESVKQELFETLRAKLSDALAAYRNGDPVPLTKLITTKSGRALMFPVLDKALTANEAVSLGAMDYADGYLAVDQRLRIGGNEFCLIYQASGLSGKFSIAAVTDAAKNPEARTLQSSCVLTIVPVNSENPEVLQYIAFDREKIPVIEISVTRATLKTTCKGARSTETFLAQ